MGLRDTAILKFGQLRQSKTFTNILWLSADKMFKIFTGVFVGAWVARYLGASNLGLLNYYIAIINILMTAATLGMDVFLVRDIVGNKDRKYQTLGTAFALRCMAIVVLFIGSIGFLLLDHISQKEVVIFCLMFISIFTWHHIDVCAFNFGLCVKQNWIGLSKH